jgi:hypothetical protein
VDPITVAKLWLIVKPVARIRARRDNKKAAAAAAAVEGEYQFDEGAQMDKALLTQLVFALLRHAMTAAGPLGISLTDDAMIQIATVGVTLAGLIWSAARKVKAA